MDSSRAGVQMAHPVAAGVIIGSTLQSYNEEVAAGNGATDRALG